MTALDRNPTTGSMLLPNRFRFFLKRAPNVEFWVQRVSLPGFSIPATDQATPFVNVPFSGEHIDYERLGITMLVDAELSNYLEVHSWLRSLGKPESFDEYARLLAYPAVDQLGPKSEILVHLLDGQQRASFEFSYHDAFPTAISGMELDATAPDLGRVVCHVEFAYSYFDVRKFT